MKCNETWSAARVLAIATAALMFLDGQASAGAPTACAGSVDISNVWNQSVQTAGRETIVSFDFAGTHDICLADGSRVIGNVVGHLVERLAPDGSLNLRFDEVLSFDDGTLGFRGEGALHDGNWRSEVQTVGTGSGVLGGIQGQGSFYPSGPSGFDDVIEYVYH
jgi:hypothetical protein